MPFTTYMTILYNSEPAISCLQRVQCRVMVSAIKGCSIRICDQLKLSRDRSKLAAAGTKRDGKDLSPCVGKNPGRGSCLKSCLAWPGGKPAEGKAKIHLPGRTYHGTAHRPPAAPLRDRPGHAPACHAVSPRSAGAAQCARNTGHNQWILWAHEQARARPR
ncbi:hypothetical protein CENSYa_0837 [Cenarchaeum symbiosum A]|uniref:Uncharacterized protein n=1 Tax=Cenarchaeum symbiosum (strain A) TaxID=414004 RepID=A0RVV3_CENSY|nr:hypothetical protein CENSYa_0837 [Cenarchaeum symbiosum A]